MNMIIDFFTTADSPVRHMRIRNLELLTGKEASLIREEIVQLMDSGAKSIYLDASKVTRVDLSGINEIIHTCYVLEQAGASFVFVYRSKSEVEKWVSATGLDKFVTTAIVTA